MSSSHRRRPLVQNHCFENSYILKSYGQVRTMLFDYHAVHKRTSTLQKICQWTFRCSARASNHTGKGRQEGTTGGGGKNDKGRGPRRHGRQERERQRQRSERPSTSLDIALFARLGAKEKRLRVERIPQSGEDTASWDPTGINASPSDALMTAMLLPSHHGGCKAGVDTPIWHFSVADREADGNESSSTQ